MDHQEMMTRRPSYTTGHEAALRAVQKPPSKPWRNGGMTPAPTPVRVYRVEPREFRDLVQRLTGAPAAVRQPQRAVVAPIQPVAVRVSGEEVAAASVPWSSFPFMAAPAAAMHPGLDGHHQLI